MNKGKRILKLAAVMGSLMVLLTGCGQKEDTATDSTGQKIIIGSDRYEPYIYQDENGNFSGIDVELATEALHRMGYEPEFREIVWENKKDYLKEGEVDCLWRCFSMDGREEEYQWAGPYLYSRQMAVVRMDSDITDIADLTGKNVAVQETSKAEEYLLYPVNENIPEVNSVYAFSSMNEVYSALRQNYVEAICGYESALDRMVESAPVQYRMLKTELFSSSFGVAFDSGYDKEFVRELSSVLEEMMQDGTTAEIVRKYGLNAEEALTGGA